MRRGLKAALRDAEREVRSTAYAGTAIYDAGLPVEVIRHYREKMKAAVDRLAKLKSEVARAA